MAEPVVYVDTSRIAEGRLEELKAAFADLVAFVDAKEPLPYSYGVYLDRERARVTVMHIHPDAASLEQHLDIAGPAFAGFADLLELESIDVYGAPSETVVERLRQKAAMLGTGAVTVHDLRRGLRSLRRAMTAGPKRRPPARIDVAPVTPDRWRDLADLFERKGPRGGTPATDWCWCMWWRARSHDRARNKAAMGKLVRAGNEPGLLAYEDGVPVGWVAIAPRLEHPPLLRSPTLKPADPAEEGVFVVTCLYVHPTAARRGVASALVAGAVDHARARGASAVEAYPTEKAVGISGSDFMGTKRMFLRAGFRPTRQLRGRTVVRFSFEPGRKAAARATPARSARRTRRA